MGGVTTVIKDGINGQKFDIDASVDAYGEYIIKTFLDEKQYKALCLSSFSEYQTRLNWDVGVQRLEAEICKRM